MEKEIHKTCLPVIRKEKLITNKWRAEHLKVTCMILPRLTMNKCQPSLCQCVDAAQLVGVRQYNLVVDYKE